MISGQRYRVHGQFFSSNPPSPDAESSRLGSSVWCHVLQHGPHWLQVVFGYDVTIEKFQTKGHDGFLGDFYVTRFEVYLGRDSDSLQPLLHPNSSEPMVRPCHTLACSIMLIHLCRNLLAVAFKPRKPSFLSPCLQEYYAS